MNGQHVRPVTDQDVATIRRLIEESALGTPGARALRDRARRDAGHRASQLGGLTRSDQEPVESTDADLVAAHAAGDPDAFAELIARHRDRMWAVAMRTLRDPEEAADALQDAFIAAFRAAGSFRAESQVTTWLHRIVVNACLDRVRRRQARPTVPLPETDADEPVPPDPMSERETRVVVQMALDQLPEDQRSLVMLIDVEGYSITAAARMLGISEDTARSRSARGRARLAKVLGHLRSNPAADADLPGSLDRLE